MAKKHHYRQQVTSNLRPKALLFHFPKRLLHQGHRAPWKPENNQHFLLHTVSALQK